MKLSRIFRKYSRVLLMVFMALLLVAFLIQDAIRKGPGQRSGREKLGEAFGGQVVHSDDLLQAESDLRVLQRMGMLQEAITNDFVVDAYLLMEEARRMGLRVGRDDAIALLKSRRVTDAQLMRVQTESHRSYEQIYETIGRWIAVQRLALLQCAGVTPSIPAMAVAYRDTQQQAVVEVSGLDARAFTGLVPEPTEAELQAFFEEARDRVSAHTDERLQFGYKLPDRVQIEYLTIDPLQIQDKITVRETDARKYFDEHKAQYKNAAPPVGPNPADASQQPGKGDDVKFEDVAEVVRKEYRTAKAIETAQGRINELYAEANKPWIAAPRDKQGFRAPPASPSVSFETLAQRSTDLPIQYVKSDLVDVDGLMKLTDFGRAVYVEGAARLRASQLALRVFGLYTPQASETLPVLNVLEPAPIVMVVKSDPATGRSVADKAILFRVVQAVPAGPPAALDDVRAQLVEDYRLVKAFELAGQFARQLQEQAATGGLAAALAQDARLREVVAQADGPAAKPSDESEPRKGRFAEMLGPINATLTRRNTFAPLVGNTGNLARDVFKLVDAPPSPTAPAHRVVVTPFARQTGTSREFKWLVAELASVKPLYAEPFEKMRPGLLNRTVQEAQRAVISEWYSTSNVRQRTQYVSRFPTGATE